MPIVMRPGGRASAISPVAIRQPAAPARPRLQEPSFTQEVANLGAALATWAKAGFPLANDAQIAQRRELCSPCEFWKAEVRQGMGKCSHSKCGCTKIKWWLKTSKCPINKW